MKKFKITFVMLFLVMILAVTAVSAADIDDSSDSATLTADDDAIEEVVSEVDDDVQAADNDAEVVAADEGNNFTSLKTLIDDSTNNLTLEKDYVRAEGESGIEINKDFTIDGNGKTIDGNFGRIFNVTSGTLTLKNLTLINGKDTEDSSAVVVDSDAKFNADYVTFINNAGSYSGAVANYGEANINHSVFDGNDVTVRFRSAASAISNLGTLIVNNTVFKNNLKVKANRTNGDYIYGIVTNLNGEMYIYNSNFTNNSGTHGGAISTFTYDGDAITVIDNCGFVDNLGYAGAAIYANGNVKLDINNSYFENNVATGYGSSQNTAAGGAICILQVTNPVTIYNNTFKGNKAINSAKPDGGAIAIESSPVNIDLCTFEDNSAEVGGAVSVDDDSTLTVSRSNFNGNDAANGTAVYNAGVLTVSNNTFGENDKIDSKTEVKKDGSKVTINPIGNVTYGTPVVVSYSIENRSSNVTASVSHKNGGIATNVTTAVIVIENDKVTVTNLTVGQYVIKIVNNEDNNVAADFETAVFNVTKANPNLQVTSKVNEFGIIEINVVADKAVTGNVTFKVINETGGVAAESTEEIVNGTASFGELTQFEKGKYNYTVEFKDDNGNYNETLIKSETPLVINKDVPTIDVYSITVNKYGLIIILTNVTKGAAGNVTYLFTSENQNLTVDIPVDENGTANYEEPTLFKPGDYEIFIVYNGDDKYYSIFSINETALTKNFTNVTHTAVVTGSEVNVTVNLGVNATGNITVVYPSGYTQNVTINNGTANFVATFQDELGPLTLVLDYDGDTNYYGFYEYFIDFTIKEATFIKAGPASAVYNTNGKWNINLIGAKSEPIVGAEIKVTINGKVYTGKTDSKGNAVITIPAKLVPKAYNAVISYAGTDLYDADSATYKFTVKKATPKVTAKKKTFKKSKKVKKYTITLKDNKGKAIKKAKVTIKVGKKTFSAKTNAKGKAVFKLKKLTKKAKYTAKVTYKGNKYFNKVTKKVKITIK